MVSETRPDRRAPLTSTYWYIDYKQFVDVVKYKLHRMQSRLQELLKAVGTTVPIRFKALTSLKEMENQDYYCPQCQKSYSTIDVQSLLDRDSFTFRCEYCSGELIARDNTEKLKYHQEMKSKYWATFYFTLQLHNLVAGLWINCALLLNCFKRRMASYCRRKFRWLLIIFGSPFSWFLG